jgi:hypothetical protein
MKKIKLLVVLVFSTVLVKAQTAEEILGKLATALGGLENLNAINTLQYSSNLKLSAMGFPIEISINHIKEKGKLYRTETSGMMGMGGSYTIVTDTAVYMSTPNIPAMGEFGGMQGGVKKLDQNVLEASKPQLSCNGYFFNLLNYQQNTASIKYVGNEKYNKVECYKLELKDSKGDKMVYFISTTTNLIEKCEADASTAMSAMSSVFGSMGGNMGARGGNFKNTKVTIVYSDYVVINNVKFPTKETIQAGANDIELTHSNFVINEPINAKLYIAN